MKAKRSESLSDGRVIVDRIKRIEGKAKAEALYSPAKVGRTCPLFD
jgi:hypothetical protein